MGLDEAAAAAATTPRPGRNYCAHASRRQGRPASTSTSAPSRQRLGWGVVALVGLGLPALASAGSAAWLGSAGPGPGHGRGPLAAFGYALPPSGSPPPFYPPGVHVEEEAHVEAAVAAAREARARRIERFPAFPETPAALAHDIGGSISAMASAAAAAKAAAAASKGTEEGDEEDGGLSFPTSTPRLRVDLQLDDLAGLSGDWARALGHRYLPFYVEVLLDLRARGYRDVLAVFGFKQEAFFAERRLRQAGVWEGETGGGIRVDHLAGRDGGRRFIDVGRKPGLVVFFNPQTVSGDLSELSEFQRAVAVATIRGAPVVLVNPALSAFSLMPQGLDVVRPMILADFAPCFQASAHRYRYNPAISYAILRRALPEGPLTDHALPLTPAAAAVAGARRSGGALLSKEGPWEVFAHDSRLPGSGWAFLESREEEPFRLEVESQWFDSCFFIKKPSAEPAADPYQEADYADYSDRASH